ncbi:MAG TPA: hypothetical protein VN345_14830, partial [Blastocatellia bacterium]|nr:hypothetical protein [Blastocatellia bacterium]
MTNTWNLRILGTSPIWGLHRPGSGDFLVPAANEAGADQPRDAAHTRVRVCNIRALRNSRFSRNSRFWRRRVTAANNGT